MKIFPSFFLRFFGLLAISRTATSTTCGATESQLANIKLMLYKQESLDNYTSVLASNAAELMDGIDVSKPTVIYVSGWTESPTSTSVQTIVGAYLERKDHNIMVANYSEIAAMDYWVASACVNEIGREVASGINSMVESGLDYSKLTVVGHSLGGQVAGAIGRSVDFELLKIIALDPAGPNFEGDVNNNSLSSTDATWVLSIHTDAGIFGASNDDGTVNFWPNGGSFAQPGCADDNAIIQNACCHFRSWKYFAESLIDEDAFIGVKCESWVAFEAGECSSDATAIMGYATPSTTTGNYYLQTAASSPFGRGVDGTAYVA